jgi:hypothetical protein
MNLAIEYILRSDRIKNLLHLPCSLFLVKNIEDLPTEKMVVTLVPSYDYDDHILIRHWNINKSIATAVLPPYQEYKIDKSEVFTSPYTVVPGYSLFRFREEPFLTGSKQYPDPPYNIFQDKEYNDCLDNFYYPKLHFTLKENWLWSTFNRIYVPTNIKQSYSSKHPKNFQREIVSNYCKDTWSTWLYWRRHLLEFSGPAAELVFDEEYKDKWPKESTAEQQASWNPLFLKSSYSYHGTIGNLSSGSVNFLNNYLSSGIVSSGAIS